MSSKDGVYKLSFLFIIFLLFATTAESAEQWNLGLPNSFSAVNVTTILNLTYLSQNSVPFVGTGGQVTQDAANLSYFITNGTMVLKALKTLGGNVSFNTSMLFIDVTNGNVGIGTTDPKHKLDSRGNLFVGTQLAGVTFSTVADTIYLGHPRKFLSNSLGVNVDGSTDWVNLLAHPGSKGIILGTSGSADATPHDAVNTRVVIQAGGNVGIGTTSFPSGGGTPVLIIKEAASAPTGVPANTSAFYVAVLSGTARPYAIDAAGTSTKLTTGNDTLLAQSNLLMPYFVNFFNPYIGKSVEYDVGQALADFELITGKKYIYIENMNKLSWADNENHREIEENNKSKEVAVQAWLNNASELEVLPSVTFEFVWDNKTITTGKVIGNTTEYSYDENGTVIASTVPVFETKVISRQKKQLKGDIQFNKSTGKFYRKPTKAEAEAVVGEAYPHYVRQPPPKWMQGRGAN